MCLVLPDFVVALERSKQDRPMLVYDTSRKRHTVFALCEAARRLGITKGMAKGRAHALCHDAEEIEMRPKRYAREAEERVAGFLWLTDRIEWEQKDSLTIWLDVGKASTSEVKTILEGLKQQINEPFQIGVANGRLLSRIAALTTPRNTVRSIAPGQEKALLSPLRLEQFATTKRFREQCDQLGIYTLDALGRLPYPSVLKRFGDGGGQLHRLFHGHDRQTLNRYAAPLREETRYHFDIPIADGCLLEQVLHQMSEHLAVRLQQQGLTSSEISLTLECENRTNLEASRRLREAVETQQALMAELARLLGQMDVTSGVEGVLVRCDHLKPPAPQQMDFFETLFGKPEPTIQDVATHLFLRHQETPLYRMILAQTGSYLPERNIMLESVTAA